MIARIWHGYTKPEHTDAYESMLKPELLPGISKVKGCVGSYLLRRGVGNEIEFIPIMLWDSVESILAIAGPDYATAMVPEERRKPVNSPYQPAMMRVQVFRPLELALFVKIF